MVALFKVSSSISTILNTERTFVSADIWHIALFIQQIDQKK